ncbi:hypothetical protein ACFLTJ_02320 [Chloroflexota bacterium]
METCVSSLNNVAASGVNEVTLQPQVVQSETVDVPLCLDSANPEAMEATPKVYKGRPLLKLGCPGER